MAFRELSPKEELKPGDHWISITQGISGYFAVEYWINPGEEGTGGPFPEPYETGIGRYGTSAEAKAEALQWAENEGLPYRF